MSLGIHERGKTGGTLKKGKTKREMEVLRKKGSLALFYVNIM